MRVFGLNVDDVEIVRRALINGPVISKPSSIFMKLRGLLGRD
jgi:hypothetical protein